MQVKIKKLSPDAITPTYATDGSACFDLYSMTRAYIDDISHSTAVVRTGLSFEIPKGHVMLVFSRSGHAFKNNVRLANCVGVIDSDYRGEVQVKVTADPDGELSIIEGTRIAQAMILPVQRVEFIEADELSNTERGAGGFGSTGT